MAVYTKNLTRPNIPEITHRFIETMHSHASCGVRGDAYVLSYVTAYLSTTFSNILFLLDELASQR